MPEASFTLSAHLLRGAVITVARASHAGKCGFIFMRTLFTLSLTAVQCKVVAFNTLCALGTPWAEALFACLIAIIAVPGICYIGAWRTVVKTFPIVDEASILANNTVIDSAYAYRAPSIAPITPPRRLVLIVPHIWAPLHACLFVQIVSQTTEYFAGGAGEVVFDACRALWLTDHAYP